jgi:hypothetical protein
MRWAITILTLGLFACNNGTNNQSEDKTSIVSNKTDNVEKQSFKEFPDCNFDYFIGDEKTPQLAKDIYLDRDWNNDYEALALLDSLTAINKQSRPFYFKVITKTYEKSDGYFSEALGFAGKEYVENNTREFIANFDNKKCFTGKDLVTWAKVVILELSMDINEKDNSRFDINDFTRKLKSNCSNCTPFQKENINEFGTILEYEWKDFLKNIDPNEKSRSNSGIFL